jgi:hypothetical protein
LQRVGFGLVVFGGDDGDEVDVYAFQTRAGRRMVGRVLRVGRGMVSLVFVLLGLRSLVVSSELDDALCFCDAVCGFERNGDDLVHCFVL